MLRPDFPTLLYHSLTKFLSLALTVIVLVACLAAHGLSAAPVPVPMAVQKWSLADGKVLEASYAGMDAAERVSLLLDDGEVYQCALQDLTPDSQALARNGGKSGHLEWVTKDGHTLEPSLYLGMDGPEHVLFKPLKGSPYRYPLKKLSPESQAQIIMGGQPRRITALIIADSMALGGFGQRLDERLRKDSAVGAVYTYMACGTNPLSWLKVKPYASIKTHCGFWSIESDPDSDKPREVADVYGMIKGHKPDPHTVPKLETLLASLKPDVLIVQCGNSFFSNFEDAKTIRPDFHSKIIAGHMEPLIGYLAHHPSNLRALYWVSPPQTGSVTEEIQSFVFDQIRQDAEPLAVLIDSRKMTHYPYKHMAADKEHFWGDESNQWADKVYDFIVADLLTKPVALLPSLNDKAAMAENANRWRAIRVAEDTVLKVKATLISKTSIPDPEKFIPYHEVLVGYKYAVNEVLQGKYDEKNLLVMHPGYIRLEKQPLDSLEVGKTYTLSLRKLDATSAWSTTRRDDASDSFDLDPYLLTADEMRYPDAAPETSEPNPNPQP